MSPEHAQGKLDGTRSAAPKKRPAERGEETMDVRVADRSDTGILWRAMARWRRAAWIVIVIADVGLLAWGAGAALLAR